MLIRSDGSDQMSDCEQFAQVAHDNRASEGIACFFEQIAHLLFRSQKTSDSLKKFDLNHIFDMFFCTLFVSFLKYSDLLILSFLMSNVS